MFREVDMQPHSDNGVVSQDNGTLQSKRLRPCFSNDTLSKSLLLETFLGHC